MGLFEKKQELGRVAGGKLEKTPAKEEKKDTSIFRGRPSIERSELRQWLSSDEAWRAGKIPGSKRPGLEKKIFDPKIFKEQIDPGEVERAYKEIRDYPQRAKEKYGIESEGERFQSLKLLEKLMGK